MAQALSGGLCPDAPGGPPAIADPHRISGGFPPVCPGLFPSWSPLIRLAGKCSVSPTPPPGCGRIGPPTSGHLRLLWAGHLVLYGSGIGPKAALCRLGLGLCAHCRHYSALRGAAGFPVGQSYALILRQRLSFDHTGRFFRQWASGAAAPVPPRSPGRCLRQPVRLPVRSVMAASWAS